VKIFHSFFCILFAFQIGTHYRRSYFIFTTEYGATNLKWRLKMSFPAELEEFLTFFGFLFCVRFVLVARLFDDLNGSVGSIAEFKPKGPGFESRISQGFFLM
jgi:hypothetical protein